MISKKDKKTVTRRNFLKNSAAISTFPAFISVNKNVNAESKELLETINSKFPQVKASHLPTPLEELDVLSSEIKVPEIFIKRDDQTGLAFGGNKARKLDFIIADALKKKSDSIITWGGEQSNWCKQTAAAAKMFGIKPILILRKKNNSSAIYDGNLLLDYIIGAEIHLIEPNENRTKIATEIADKEKKKGHNPYIVAVGGSQPSGSMTEPIGAISYTKAFIECWEDIQEQDIKINSIVHATGSGGTQAGLIVGAKALNSNMKIVGISISGSKESIKKNVANIANQSAKALDLKLSFSQDEVIVFDDYVGDGYGILNQETVDAISTVAKKEGIFLDPVYTGKAMSGLFNLVKKGYFKNEDSILFIHTGGTPALFVYKEKLMNYLKA